MCNSKHHYNDGIQIYGFQKLCMGKFQEMHVGNSFIVCNIMPQQPKLISFKV